jgi:RNA polymerase sigma factor (TIGR02999 family)
MSDVTRILVAAGQGDSTAAEQLLPLLYDELRRMAAARLAREQPGQTLQATALVHEAWLRLVGDSERAKPWENRAHFFAAAAEAMRRILIDGARSRARLKRAGDRERRDLSESFLATDVRTDEMLAISEALDRLEEHDPQAACLVKLRYFVGMQHQDAAEALNITRREADGLWMLAKAWLLRELKAENLENLQK